jgi:hypothetical protein
VKVSYPSAKDLIKGDTKNYKVRMKKAEKKRDNKL